MAVVLAFWNQAKENVKKVHIWEQQDYTLYSADSWLKKVRHLSKTAAKVVSQVSSFWVKWEEIRFMSQMLTNLAVTKEEICSKAFCRQVMLEWKLEENKDRCDKDDERDKTISERGGTQEEK